MLPRGAVPGSSLPPMAGSGTGPAPGDCVFLAARVPRIFPSQTEETTSPPSRLSLLRPELDPPRNRPYLQFICVNYLPRLADSQAASLPPQDVEPTSRVPKPPFSHYPRSSRVRPQGHLGEGLSHPLPPSPRILFRNQRALTELGARVPAALLGSPVNLSSLICDPVVVIPALGASRTADQTPQGNVGE